MSDSTLLRNGQNGTSTAPPFEKLVPLETLPDKLRAHRERGETIVQCHGVFDLLHPGHVRHFKAAKQEGEVLVVTLTPDRFVNKGPGRPVFNELLRAEFIASLESVDYVAINHWPTAVEVIGEVRPDVYVKGSDYADDKDDLTGKIVDEREAVEAHGGRVHFTQDITFSSTRLLNNHFNVFSEEAEVFLEGFRRRWSADDIIGMLDSLHDMKVLVIGDIIIDEYHFCQAMGMASKSTTINAKYLDGERHAGGVLAVANHVAGFCDTVHLVSLVGDEDDQVEFIESKLNPKISSRFFSRPDGPTTRKVRYLHKYQYQKMFELTYIEDGPLPQQVEENLNQYVQEIASDYDLVLVTDFGHGMIGPSTVAALAETAPFIALNTQVNSANRGFNALTKYPRADYVCIDQEEIRHTYHDRFGPLQDLIQKAVDDLSASFVTVTRGHRGSTTYRRGNGMHHTPVFSEQAVDTIGAGDAFLSITSPLAARGYPAEVISFVGNAVGALAIQVLGNRSSVQPVELKKYITTLLK
ncbi:adenylyltransferase/cytidyltransferase family protein [bacterium]|nr:adenylyltransferase/cytidyltransferase family protein [bacterium]